MELGNERKKLPPEAVELYTRFIHGEIGRRDHDFEFALEAVIESFSYLHRHILCLLPLYTAPMGLRRQAPLTEAVQTGGVPGRA